MHFIYYFSILFRRFFMMKKLKITSSILATSLIITPISSILNQNDNIAEAKYTNKKTNKKIIQEIKFSDYEVFQAAKKAYENGELKISKEKLNEFESQLRLRGYWGENKIVQFWDGAIDVYISGAVLTFASSLGVGTILKYIPKISKYSGVLGALGGTLLGGLKAINNGVIIYFKKQVVRGYYKGSPTGGYVTKYIYQHWRHQ